MEFCAFKKTYLGIFSYFLISIQFLWVWTIAWMQDEDMYDVCNREFGVQRLSYELKGQILKIWVHICIEARIDDRRCFLSTEVTITVGHFENIVLLLKFGLSEKHTKFEKIFLTVWTFTKQMYKPWGRFFQILCVSHKFQTL